MADLARRRVDGIEEAVAVVDLIARAQRLDVGEGISWINGEREEGGVGRDRRFVVGATIAVGGQGMSAVGKVVTGIIGRAGWR